VSGRALRASATSPRRSACRALSAVEGVFARMGAETKDFRITISRIVGYGETVLVQGRYSRSRAAHGTSFDLQMAHIWDFEGGKAVRCQQCTDTLGWARATGDMK
jgi:ketosteroid isomerase-like protein